MPLPINAGRSVRSNLPSGTEPATQEPTSTSRHGSNGGWPQPQPGGEADGKHPVWNGHSSDDDRGYGSSFDSLGSYSEEEDGEKEGEEDRSARSEGEEKLWRHVGTYDDELDAAPAYEEAALHMLSRDADLNFPPPADHGPWHHHQQQQKLQHKLLLLLLKHQQHQQLLKHQHQQWQQYSAGDECGAEQNQQHSSDAGWSTAGNSSDGGGRNAAQPSQHSYDVISTGASGYSTSAVTQEEEEESSSDESWVPDVGKQQKKQRRQRRRQGQQQRQQQPPQWQLPQKCGQQQQQQRPGRAGRFRGVYHIGGKWRATLWVPAAVRAKARASGTYLKEQVYLGQYNSEEEAARVHDQWALRVLGRNAKLNFNASDYRNIDTSCAVVDDKEDYVSTYQYKGRSRTEETGADKQNQEHWQQQRAPSQQQQQQQAQLPKQQPTQEQPEQPAQQQPQQRQQHQEQNQQRRFLGVSYDAGLGRWQASLCVPASICADALARGLHLPETLDLGNYDSEEEAARAHDRGALRTLGRDAQLNFNASDYNIEDIRVAVNKDKDEVEEHSASDYSDISEDEEGSSEDEKGVSEQQEEQLQQRQPPPQQQGRLFVPAPMLDDTLSLASGVCTTERFALGSRHSSAEEGACSYVWRAQGALGRGVRLDFNASCYSSKEEWGTNMQQQEQRQQQQQQLPQQQRKRRFRGVHAINGSWWAVLSMQEPRPDLLARVVRLPALIMHLGLHSSAEEAARAYDRAMLRMLGRDAQLNFSASDYSDDGVEDEWGGSDQRQHQEKQQQQRRQQSKRQIQQGAQQEQQQTKKNKTAMMQEEEDVKGGANGLGHKEDGPHAFWRQQLEDCDCLDPILVQEVAEMLGKAGQPVCRGMTAEGASPALIC